MGSISIVEVAKRAGVSVATASRVISNSDYPVSELTRQKVLEAATELNYVPNTLARNLRTQRSNLIAVLVGDNTDPYFAQITRGVEEVANESGYLTIICNTDRQTAKELKYLQALRDYRVDGVIFAGGGLNEPGYPQLLEKQIKIMQEQGANIITLSQHTLQVPSVQADNFNGAREMTKRLIELGHRQIAFVTGPANLLVANIRFQGYMAALTQAGLPIQPQLLLVGDFSRAGGEQAVQSLRFLPPEQRPTAIFAANDETAFGVMLGLHKFGWRVPQDISVCGFGDLPFAEMVVPALTTVHIDLRELGRSGALRLLDAIREQPVEKLHVLPTTIIERDSTAPYEPD